QLLVIEDAHPTLPRNRMSVEREVHFFDPVLFRARAERRLGSRRPAAEDDAFAIVHRRIIPSRSRPESRRRSGESLEDSSVASLWRPRAGLRPKSRGTLARRDPRARSPAERTRHAPEGELRARNPDDLA